jgi:hypothetical protein
MRWSYKTVHFELKKEGILGSAFLDEPEIELSLNQYGKAGWELVSLLETMDGLIAIFKQPFGLDTRSFSPPSESIERMKRVPKELEKTELEKTKAQKIRFAVEKEMERSQDEEEAILLDEYEVVEDQVEKPVTKRSVPPKDIGSIRIE